LKAPRLFFYAQKNLNYKETTKMAKTRLEKIANYDERIAQLENQRKLEQQRLKAEERKQRDRRLYKRAGLLESPLPETITLTDEQFTTYLHRTVGNKFGRDKLAEIIAVGEKSAGTPPKTTAEADNHKPQSVTHDSTSDNAANPQDGTRSGA